MIALARKRAPQARFVAKSFLDLEWPACDAVTAMGECFNYSFDPRNNRAQLRRLFRRIYEALRPGGVLVFDIVQQGRVPGGSRRNWWEGPD